MTAATGIRLPLLAAAALWALACNGNGVEAPDTDLADGADASVGDAGPGASDCPRPVTVFADLDGDGHGDGDTAQELCNGVPDGWVTVGNDCDDACPECSPIGTEMCDGLDNDCDGLLDDGLMTETFYLDVDGDGFGVDAGSVTACTPPQGHVAVGGDCRDDLASVSPGAGETCNAVDDDCNGLADDGLIELTGDDVFLGDANATFREIGIAGWQGGWLAAWTSADRRVVFLPVGPEASVSPASIQPIAPALDALTGQETPSVAIVQGEERAWGVVSWLEGDVIRARSVRLPEGTLGSAVTVSRATDLSRLPLVVETTREDAVIVWVVNADRQETRARTFDPATGALGEEVTVFRSDRTSPDNWGPSAVVLPSEPDVMYLGVVNLVYPDEVPVGYVRRIRLRPQLTPMDTRPARLAPADDRAADRLVLARGMDRDAGDESLLAFLASGAAPELRTEAFRITAHESALTADHVADIDGLVLDAVRAPGGADVTLRSHDVTDRVTLSLARVGSGGDVLRIGTLDTLLPPTWAAMARRNGIYAAAIWSGRVSESDIDPGVWFRRYGCGF